MISIDLIIFVIDSYCSLPVVAFFWRSINHYYNFVRIKISIHFKYEAHILNNFVINACKALERSFININIDGSTNGCVELV